MASGFPCSEEADFSLLRCPARIRKSLDPSWKAALSYESTRPKPRFNHCPRIRELPAKACNHKMAAEKSEVTTVVEQTTSSGSSEEEGLRQRPDRDVRNAVWTIVTGVALPCIPIIVILAILLYFIFHRVKPWNGYAELAMNTNTTQKHGFDARLSYFRHEGGAAAYLVHYNPSTLTTIASWTSRIIPYLTSSIMALVAFFAARYIVQQSKKGDDAVLPDPEQLTILIGLLGNNGVTPLKDTLFYRWLNKERLIHPVPAVFWVLAFITRLGYVDLNCSRNSLLTI